MRISNKTYDKMKWIISIVLPAVATLVSGLGAAYGIENTELIVTTITLVTAFLGTVFMVSSKKYDEQDKSEEE